MIRPLLILHGFRRSLGPSGQIQRVFWNEASQKGYVPTVIADDGDLPIPSNITVETAKSKGWLANPARLIRKVGLPDFCHLPDLYVYSWNPFAISVGKRLCKENHYDYISSVSFPHSSHLIAYKLKKKTGLPWVAQFYDPWTEHSTLSYRIGYFKRKISWMEAIVAKHADIIIHSNQKIYDNWLKRYGKLVEGKMKVLPFSYNINPLPPQVLHQKGEKLRIAHIGHIYGGRSSIDFVNALKKLKNKVLDFENKIQVTYIGVVPSEERELIASSGLENVFTFINTLAPEDLQKYYDETDIFLLFDVNIKESPFFPSKLMMYEYYCRPILSITTQGSVIEGEMKAANYPVFYYGNSEPIYGYLKQAINNYESLMTFDTRRWKIYQVSEVLKEYNEIIKGIIKR